MLKKITALVLCLILSFSLLGCTAKNESACSGCKTITDQAGRQVKIPAKINKIYCTSTLGTVFIYSLAPENLAAWNDKISEKSSKYLLPEMKKLPVAGSLQGKKSGNIEEISKIKPDIVISMGDVNETTISGVEKFQKQSDIPFILVDGKMDKLPEAYRFVGELLNKKDKAEELAVYCEKILKESKENTAKLGEDKKLKVYYAEGPKGLETDPEDSLHAEVIKYAGGKNVATFPVKHGTRNTVSMEQIISWNPDAIVSDSNVFTDDSWKQVSAVNQNKIYIIPNVPFNWFDKPPSINRLIGIKWMQASLYPDSYKGDMVKDTKEFFKLFYHKDLSDEEANNILKPNPSSK